ncbi:hypothetical protein [Paenibacillus residui]|uniref:Uncharacterized protein n=1 Tax=Paenibacillus residui TaxID=629724 RepID=A0ABW3D5T8_9BACL
MEKDKHYAVEELEQAIALLTAVQHRLRRLKSLQSTRLLLALEEVREVHAILTEESEG